ncbi:uroporphyrinogen-III synthase [Nitratireductor basaltis]|uniref:uroporphyrinogen-III synthase n=1 Tax=Nitratireductor basaltis TaxID=472175 RepID=UPI001377C88A|nr:uroporphyrinogen-III synthase [Nitratireductor basaltis]
MRVLITRPQPGADETAERVRALGLTPVVSPLTQTLPNEPAYPPELEAASLVAISSPNAVRHAPRALLRKLTMLPAFAVGEKTGEVAKAGGLQVVACDAGDARQLAAQVIGKSQAGETIAILCGRVRRGVLEQSLHEAGRLPLMLETYDTRALQAHHADWEGVDVVLLYSSYAAELFLHDAGNRKPPLPLDKTRFVCISARVAERLMGVAPENVIIASQPDEVGMMKQLALLR